MRVVAEHTEQAEQVTDRETLVREIAELEALIQEKRALLPIIYKQIFVFRCHPEKKVMVYAASLDEARQKLHARMNLNYGENWEVASQAVSQYDLHEAARTSLSGNWLSNLTL